jgi:hypothetical protein
MSAVTRLSQFFHVDEILNLIPDNDALQIALTHSKERQSWDDGVGSLYDYGENRVIGKTSDFTILNERLKGTYIETVIQEVEEQAAKDSVSLGRIRILKLLPKTCYSLHRDIEEFRYHIPLKSSPQCFFVSGDRVEYMTRLGGLYRFRTREPHTAVNASFEDRIHLVFDTY